VFQPIIFPLFRYDAMQERALFDALVGGQRDPVVRIVAPDFHRRRMTPLQARFARA
jgi:hypothetical protein